MPAEPPQTQGIWAEHWPALEAFLAICRQWRVVASERIGMRTIGLDYGAVEAGFRLSGVSVTPDVWSEVQLIEQGALDAMNDQ